MANLTRLWILVLSVAWLSVASAAGLTEDSVKDLISKIDKAVHDLDARAMGAVMTDDVEIILNMTNQGMTQIWGPSKQEYLAATQQGWDTIKNYKYSRLNLVIRLMDNKAVVTSDIMESMTVEGQDMSGVIKEEVVIELINGTPMITKVTGYADM